ncbi:hypothetical protein LX99_02795 [Mucilaginibacter oryzae]|uniref:Uncharacterized protein n=1 Tax=Mucilaginibacter oryzae TaxID=468058 RepID=A0A316HD48_9SPHI|nr:hypothetical protein [Mucilaginibacter oryzae]PWK77910.1 hypothetical protein LX99_02795 [Mucilaginibacter oryzae]
MNTNKEQLDLSTLMKYLSFANTPSYLYKHYKENDSIATLSSSYSTDAIVSDFMAIVNTERRTIEDLTLLYSFIIALTFKPTEQVNFFFKQLKDAPLRWAEKIASIYFANNSSEVCDYNIVSENISFQKDLKVNTEIF